MADTKFIWIDGTSDEISLAAIGPDFPVKYGRQKNDLKEVVIGDRVKSIDEDAFRMCKNLEKVEMSDSVQAIMPFAFAWCDKLEEMRFPEGIDIVGISVMTNCPSLKKVSIPDSVTMIDEEAFSYCTGLTNVKMPESLESIYVSAFMNCKNLREVTIPAATVTIATNAFLNCESLEKVTFEEGSQLKEIVSGAFANCPKLKTENFEKLTKLKSIGDRAFEGCTSIDHLEFPEGVTKLAKKAFSGCSSLAGNIRIPVSIKSISDEVFMNCTSITSVEFTPKNEYEIKSGLFSGCTGLENASGLINAKSIGDRAFLGCSGLKEIKLGKSLKSIGDWAFKGCLSLELTVPSSVSSIGTDAFAYTADCKYDGSAEINQDTHMYFKTAFNKGSKKTEELRYAAADVLGYLQSLRRSKDIPEDISSEYEEALLKYIGGDDNEYALLNKLFEFDDKYGTDALPLSDPLEVLHDRLYMFEKELA